ELWLLTPDSCFSSFIIHHFNLPPSNLTRSFARDAKRQARFFGEVLNRAQELLAVTPGDVRGLVCRFNRVRVAETRHAFGAHRVNHIIQQTRLINPDGNVEACGRALAGRLQIDESDERLAVSLILESLARILTHAVAKSRAVTPRIQDRRLVFNSGMKKLRVEERTAALAALVGIERI